VYEFVFPGRRERLGSKLPMDYPCGSRKSPKTFF